jgi:hypothetical protein
MARFFIMHSILLKALAISLVPLAPLGFRTGILFLVLSKASAHVIGLFELALLVSPDKTLVGTSIDQFTRHSVLLSGAKKHLNSLSSKH